jgi:hypothetical protein
MSGPDEVVRRERDENQIEFFATLPSSVNPNDPEAVRSWLALLGDALTGVHEIEIFEKVPPSDVPTSAEDPGAWFAIKTLGHPICPGRVPGDGDEPGDEGDGGDVGDGGAPA